MKTLLLTGAATLLIAGTALGTKAPVDPHIDVSEFHLKNGLTLLVVEDHSAPVVNFQSWFHVGSKNEESGHLGLTHMFEHMMFKGSKKYGPEEHARIVQSNGGRANAYTTEDVTVYHETIAASQLELIVALEAERMMNLNVNHDNLMSEREVVYNERLQRIDNSIYGTLFEQLKVNAYQYHPYRNPVIGWLEDIANYEVESCQEFFDTWYNPGNCTLVITGDVQPDAVLTLVEKYYGPMPARDVPHKLIYKELPQRGEKRIDYHMNTQLPLVAIAWHAVALTDPDYEAWQVLQRILTGSETSRLKQRLVQNDQLATWIGGGMDEMEDPGLFTLFSSPMPGVDVADLESAIYEELERLATEPVSDRELQRAKNQLEDEFIYNLRETESKGTLIGHFAVRAGDYNLVNSYLADVRAVTAEDVQRLIQTYFTEMNRTVVTILPEI